MFVFIHVGIFAQHYPMYSQYLLNGLAINPAYAGRNDALDVTLMHRRQWIGVDGAPITTAFTIHSPLRKKTVNLGLSIVDDRLGVSKNQLINAIYAYRIKIGKAKLSFGLQGGLSIRKTNWDALKRNDQKDALIPNEQVTKTDALFGVGIYLHEKNAFFGISMPYIINTVNTLSYKESPVFATAGYLFKINEHSNIKPSLLVKKIARSPLQIDVNVNYYYKLFGVGISYRTNESVIGILEIKANDQFKLSYSYDFGISKFKSVHSGSHELMLRYLFGYSYYAKNPRNFAL